MRARMTQPDLAWSVNGTQYDDAREAEARSRATGAPMDIAPRGQATLFGGVDPVDTAKRNVTRRDPVRVQTALFDSFAIPVKS